MPHANEIPSQDKLVPPEPTQGVLRNREVLLALIAPAGAQANPPMVREDLSYKQFRRTKVLEFKRITSPWNGVS